MRNKNKNKRGSHIGIVLSMIIFVSFLIFLYIVIEPAIKTQKDKQILLDSLKLNLQEELFANLTIVTISIDEGYSVPPIKDCLNINHVEGVGNLDSIVRNETGIVKSDSYPTYLKIEWPDHNKRFFKIYYSEESFNDFPFEGGDCVSPGEGTDYMIESIKTNEKIFETKIIEFMNLYENSYEDVKEMLNFPAGNEFGFSFTYSNETTIGIEEINISLDIYTEDVPVQYVNKSANVNLGYLTVIVW